MEGRTPIGYVKQDKKLVPEEKGAETVGMIFDKYLECKSVQKLKEYLDENKTSTGNNEWFSKGQLYHLLTNEVYIGKVTHFVEI